MSDFIGNDLSDAIKRKKAKRVYYALTFDNIEKTTFQTEKKDQTNAENSALPKQNVRSTKEIFTKQYNVEKGQRTADHIRIQQLKDQEQRMQLKRNSWN
ncbi:MAG: hypothetical protein GKR88_04245 [Flavobacteriaceae bacterium]|nr:MAG: hypothetical protein GKR88_04245 [Flavobacteriaceae bacterium]